MTELCSECGEKPRDGKHRVCRRCRAKREYANRDPVKWDEQQRRWRLKCIYGITLEQYEELLDSQDGVCAICGRPDPIEGRRLAVDHDHVCCPGTKSCGRCIRGLLCSKCNTALGILGDDKEVLMNALSYLGR